MKVRFIIDIYTSKRDRNGNTYTAAQLTSTLSGKSLWMHAHSDSNARIAVGKAADKFVSEFCHVTEQTVGYREVMKLRDIANHGEEDITAEVLANLETR